MKLLRYFVIVAAGLALAAFASTAMAGDKRCSSCGHGHSGKVAPQPTTLFSGFGHKNLPAFQAAPWYNYWPYDGHFLTPAPVSGAFYGPPLTGNFPVNPYFPNPGFGGYGPMPGGPPPAMHPPVQPGR